jgi:hypothetical protein
MQMILEGTLSFQSNVFFKASGMKTNLGKINNLVWSALRLSFACLLIVSCEVDDPVKEEVPELITEMTLTFTPSSGGGPVIVMATDPDGEGVQDIQVDGIINLAPSQSYFLSIELINGLAQPSDPEYNITDEVEEEGDEHMFFFSWTNNVFGNPVGNGNIDNRADAVNYEDEDANGLPLGLQTSWTTAEASTGNFRVILKHQPDLKSETSDSSTGETDLDITFTITVE